MPKGWIETGEGWDEAPASARRTAGSGRQVDDRGTRVLSSADLERALESGHLKGIELAPSVGARVVREMAQAAGLRGVGRVRRQDRVVIVVRRG